jgi:hypothetical protein
MACVTVGGSTRKEQGHKFVDELLAYLSRSFHRVIASGGSVSLEHSTGVREYPSWSDPYSLLEYDGSERLTIKTQIGSDPVPKSK